jgi:hypothetical protein
METVPLIIQVKWIDAVADSGWEEKTKAEIHHCLTVGFLIDETDEALCIASTWSHNQTNARIHIPKAWIKDRKVLQNETVVSKAKRKTAPTKGKRRSATKVSTVRD